MLNQRIHQNRPSFQDQDTTASSRTIRCFLNESGRRPRKTPLLKEKTDRSLLQLIFTSCGTFERLSFEQMKQDERLLVSH